MVDYHCMLDCKFFEDRSTDGITDGYCKKYNQSLVFYDWWEKCNGCYRETLRKAYYSTKTNKDKR